MIKFPRFLRAMIILETVEDYRVYWFDQDGQITNQLIQAEPPTLEFLTEFEQQAPQAPGESRADEIIQRVLDRKR